MNAKTNRRQFLKTTAAAGIGYWIAERRIRAEGRSPNEKLNIAAIGCGGKGRTDIEHCSSENIVALCDVDDSQTGKQAQKYPRAKRYRDFRRMLEEMAREIDAVTISTPDHQHAVAAMMAMKMGKHVYCQKPLTHDVYEARALTEAAAKYKVATQMGNQGTAEDGLREAVEVVRAGTLGAVREVHVWTNRPVWPQGTAALLALAGVQAALHGRRDDADAVPRDLDWDLWLGTAPERRYYRDVYHPFKWRGWWDFGCGALGDMACHTANMAFMACRLGYPTSVEAECSEFNPETFPMWSVIRYDFPARDGMPPLKWTWYDGGRDKPAWVNRKLKELAHGMEISGSGSMIIGEKATLFSPNDYGAKYYLLFGDEKPIGPLPDAKLHKAPDPTLPRAPGSRNEQSKRHYLEWILACKGGPPAMASFAYAGPLTETVVLGNVALRAGRKIEWDGPNMKITNAREPNQYLRREYRKGWEL